MKMIYKTQKQNKISAVPKFMPQVLPDDKIAKGINSLNLKQGEVIHTWFIHGLKIMQIVMGIMLNQCIYFFQAVERQVNLIW